MVRKEVDGPDSALVLPNEANEAGVPGPAGLPKDAKEDSLGCAIAPKVERMGSLTPNGDALVRDGLLVLETDSCDGKDCAIVVEGELESPAAPAESASVRPKGDGRESSSRATASPSEAKGEL